MKLTMEFNPQDKDDVASASQVVGLFAQGAHVNITLDPAGAAPTKVVADVKKTKADDAADKKAKDDEAAAAKKAEDDAAAAKKVEEDAAAAKKAEEEAAAAAAKKAEEEAAAGEDDDFLGGDGADEQPELTLEQVRQALTDYSKIEGRPAAIKILNEKGGVKSIGELPKDKFRAVYDAAKVKK